MLIKAYSVNDWEQKPVSIKAKKTPKKNPRKKRRENQRATSEAGIKLYCLTATKCFVSIFIGICTMPFR